MSIVRLKSRGSPPWGCTLEGYCTAMFGATTTGVKNLIVRFFTPNTDTELAKTAVPTSTAHLHITDDTVNTIAAANATDQATLNTLLNEIKADYNLHRVDTTYHNNADTTNAVTSADSSSEATAVTLANEIKADFNAHRMQATIHPYNDNRYVVTAANATVLADAITLANDIKTMYSGTASHRNGICSTFTIYGIAPGTYDIGAKNDGSLSMLAQDVVLTPGASVRANLGGYYHGDINNDDQANTGDSLLIAKTVAAGVSPGPCQAYAGNWLITDPNTFGDWTSIPTARRKTY